MATIKDVAKEARVSVATVSRVINGSPKVSAAALENVQLAMKKLGYRPNANARALVQQNSQTVGVLIGDVSDPFFGTLVKSVDEVARQHGKHILIANGYHDVEQEKQAIELLMRNRCDAMVVHAKALSDKALINYAQEMPSLVYINRYIPEIADRCIALDNYQGAYLATQALIQQGHQKIAYITSTHQIEDVQQRRSGHLQALHTHHLAIDEAMIEYAQPDSIGGKQAIQHLLNRYQVNDSHEGLQSLPFTAIATYNDHMAAGVLSELLERHIRVPQDIAVIGFDDALIADYLHPKLSTVHYPIKAMAQASAELAIALANNNDNKNDSDNKKEDTAIQPSLYTPTLILRDSI